MKKMVPFFFLMFCITIARAADTNTTSRGAQASWMAAPRATASVKQINAMAGTNKSSIRVEPIVPVPVIPEKDMREAEKKACIGNNIGAGNTFVWASKNSNTSNYSSMIEDTEQPENNVCFVKVELKSDDSKISVADIAPVYFEMGKTITCGSWADDGVLKDRILDAKKSARTWGTVAGAVGGAGVGVGAMELFGNKLIGGSVQGQKSKKLDENERLRSQILVLREKDINEFNNLKKSLKSLRDECDNKIWLELENIAEKPDECTEIDYNYLLSIQ